MSSLEKVSYFELEGLDSNDVQIVTYSGYEVVLGYGLVYLKVWQLRIKAVGFLIH